ncbi:unnamed protein product, partial [Discosporangium mesarthrocarpum]
GKNGDTLGGNGHQSGQGCQPHQQQKQLSRLTVVPPHHALLNPEVLTPQDSPAGVAECGGGVGGGGGGAGSKVKGFFRKIMIGGPDKNSPSTQPTGVGVGKEVAFSGSRNGSSSSGGA